MHNFKHFLHGGDYNPEQWLANPQILEEDVRLMKQSHTNAVTIGVFSWVSYEPEEGRFNFDWMDRTMDRLEKNGIDFILATPSGAKPAWMSRKYPEIRRVNDKGLRDPHGSRHNHCPSSPVYREKVEIINNKLAERYGKRPGLLMWHISNEYGGECRCELCFKAFQGWLQKRYGTLERLTDAWWSRFWSHTYTAWDQIDHVDGSIHCMDLDFRRFTTDHFVDFMLHEIAPLKRLTPDVPVTTNMMGLYPGLDYWKFAPHVDIISWDAYPRWHPDHSPDWRVAVNVAMTHDINRCMKRQPWLLIESTPSLTNWAAICKPKRPNMHLLSSLQAVAHGSEGVMVFQWRKSRGSIEKFHGAVVDHVGTEHTRVFREVTTVGESLEKIAPVLGGHVKPQVAMIYDWENRWAVEAAKGPRNEKKDYVQSCEEAYAPFWQSGIPVDVINEDCEFDANYKLVIAPMLYMLRPGLAERITRFVENGGTFVTTYLAGEVDESDLCFLGGFPGPLRKLLGIWAEETDALYDNDVQTVVASPGNAYGLSGAYAARHLCDVIHTEGADVLATYGHDYYAGKPAVTVNPFGRGRAFYIASRNDERFHTDFYGALIRSLRLERALDSELPQGVAATWRDAPDGRRYVFVMNFVNEPKEVKLASSSLDLLTGAQSQTLKLEPFGVAVLA